MRREWRKQQDERFYGLQRTDRCNSQCVCQFHQPFNGRVEAECLDILGDGRNGLVTQA